MIYSIILVDGDSGILLLEKQMKDLDKKSLSSDVLAGFFKALNGMIDEIQIFIKKGRDVSNMTREVNSENSRIILHYMPEARVLICSISDPDDDAEKIIETLRILAKRFWLKHRSDIEKFRKDSLRDIFNSFSVDIDTYTLEGRVAESFPKVIISDMALERVKMMGIVDATEYKVIKMCNGKTSALKISKDLEISLDKVKLILNKLGELDLVKNPK